MSATLRSVLAASAIAGGCLRIVNAFPLTVLNETGLQVAYAVTDTLLLLGLVGILFAWRSELERLGYAGIAVIAIGLMIIRATAFSVFVMDGYRIGAGVAVAGVTLLSVDLLWRNAGSRLAPCLWLAAFVLATPAAFNGHAMLATLAGIAFGAGFAAAGFDLLCINTERAAPDWRGPSGLAGRND